MALTLLFFGLVMLAQPFLHYFEARKTTYVVTDRRLVIFNGIIQDTIESYAPPLAISQRENKDGSGTLSFPSEIRWPWSELAVRPMSHGDLSELLLERGHVAPIIVAGPASRTSVTVCQPLYPGHAQQCRGLCHEAPT